jgi:hypothetical protein
MGFRLLVLILSESARLGTISCVLLGPGIDMFNTTGLSSVFSAKRMKKYESG